MPADVIGFVGIGNMGLPMAKNILASGRRVVAWSRSADECAAFAAAGGEVVESLADIHHLPVVLSIVFDDGAVRDIVFGPGGLLHGLDSHAIHVNMETISPALARQVTQAYAAKGIRHLTSPVFGPPQWAAARELKFNCSGAREVYEQVEPVLAAMGRSHWFGPEPEQGLMVKLMGNNMIFTLMELVHEAFTLLGRCGIKEEEIKHMLIERLFQSPIMTRHAEYFAQNPGKPPPFSSNAIPRKDNALCMELATSLGVELPLVNIVSEMIRGSR